MSPRSSDEIGGRTGVAVAGGIEPVATKPLEAAEGNCAVRQTVVNASKHGTRIPERRKESTVIPLTGASVYLLQ